MATRCWGRSQTLNSYEYQFNHSHDPLTDTAYQHYAVNMKISLWQGDPDPVNDTLESGG
jgi:hypothetical protein